MNKKLITALIFTFIAVKNPVFSLGEVQEAYAAESQNIKVNAISEANITRNIESLYRRNDFQTIEEKAQIQLSSYKKALDEQKIKEKIAEEARLQAQNIDRTQKLNTAGLSASYVNLYVKAEQMFGVPWEILAAVHTVETHQSGDTVVTSYAGAQGPMQFMPTTFKAYAIDGDGDGVASIGKVEDAIMSAANYLSANGASRGDVTNALYHYNHDYSYVYHVLSIARSIGYSK